MRWARVCELLRRRGENRVRLRRHFLRERVLGSCRRHAHRSRRWVPLRRTLVAFAVLIGGCLIPTEDHNVGSGPAVGPLGGGGGANVQRCVKLLGYDETLCVTVRPVVCSGHTCANGEVCCQTTGACVAPGSPACPNPPTNDRNGLKSCGSNADCTSAEYCVPDGFELNSSGPQMPRCIGFSGHCQPLANCAYCGGAPGACKVCGCDGVTYDSPQAACVAGVSTGSVSLGACGEPNPRASLFDGGAFTISCGRHEQCRVNAQCCFLTGRCFDASEPWRCALQPNNSILNCGAHAECNEASGGGSGQDDTRLCQADACGGPGLCSTRWPPSSCGGEMHSVCGCDGITYVNECWARSAGARVAHEGVCP